MINELKQNVLSIRQKLLLDTVEKFEVWEATEGYEGHREVERLKEPNEKPLTKLGSRRMMNKRKTRAGGDPKTEGKWRVLKLGNGTRVTVNLVCGYCGQDNTTSSHRRLRCDLCDRPFRQRGYTRAVGAKLPPGKLHV